MFLKFLSKFTEKRLHQTLFTPAQMFPWEFFKRFYEHLFYRTSLNDCIWFQVNLLTVLKRFCFRTDQFLFKIPSYFRVYQNSLPPGPLGLHTFFTLNKYYCGKDYNCIKKFMIFISKSMLTISTKRPRVLNMPLVLKIPGFWICLWFWICQGSEYTRGLNMSGIEKVLNMLEYVWLHMSGYVWICPNLPEWLLFYISPL